MFAETQLVEVPAKETALQVYSAANGLDPFLAKIREEIDGFVPDVTTRKGREAIASIAYKVARSKTALDNVGKELVADLKEVPKKVDAERKRMRDLLDSWQAEVRQPLTEWEQREEMRKAKHQAGIDQINLRLECRDLDSTELKANIEWLEGLLIGEDWEEFETEAARTKDKALVALREALVAREKYEAEQAELERLRAEAAVASRKSARNALPAKQQSRHGVRKRPRPRQNATQQYAVKPKHRPQQSAANLNLSLPPSAPNAKPLKPSSAQNKQSVMRNVALKKPQRQNANGRPMSRPASNARLLHAKPTRRTRKPSTTRRWRRSSLVAWMRNAPSRRSP